MVEYRNTVNRESSEDTRKRGFGLATRMDLSKYNAPGTIQVPNTPTSVAAINQAQQVPTIASAPTPQQVAAPSGQASAPSKGFGLDQERGESIARLRELGLKSQTPREWTTPLGSQVQTVNRNYNAAIEAEKAIGDLVNTMYGQEIARETGAARTALGVERNKLLQSEGIEARKLQGRGLLQREILAERDRGQRQQAMFEKQLLARSPRGEIDKAANTKIGMFRMALEGVPVHEQYKSQADELMGQFRQFLNQNRLPDTPENRQLAVQQFEKTLSGE